MIKKKYYYQGKFILMINVRNTQDHSQKLTPDSISVNGTSIETWTYDNDYNVIFQLPVSSASSTFTISVAKEGYVTYSSQFTYSTLNTGDILLTPQQTNKDFNFAIHWTPPTGTAYDIDNHLLIINNSTSTKSHLSYASNNSGEGYEDSITVDGTIYKLNYDDDPGCNWGSAISSSTKNNHTENLMGEVKTGYTYKFIVEDYIYANSGGSEGHMSDCSCTATLTFGSDTYTYNVPIGNYKYWVVCTLTEYQDQQGNTYWDINRDSQGEQITGGISYNDTNPY